MTNWLLEPATLPHPSKVNCCKSFGGSDLCEMGTVSSNRDKRWLQWAWRKTVLPNSWSVLQNFENLLLLTFYLKEMFWFLFASKACMDIVLTENTVLLAIRAPVLPIPAIPDTEMGFQAAVGRPQLTPTETQHAILCRHDFSYIYPCAGH